MLRTRFTGWPAAGAMAVLAGVGLLAAVAGPVLAQSADFDTGDPAVTVDMSVLEGGSSASAPVSSVSPGAGFRGRLMMPGAEIPVSRLHVVPRSDVAIAPPAAPRTAATAPRTPAMPPVKAPESALQTPPATAAPSVPQVAAPSRPQPAPAAPAPAPAAPPAKPQDLAAAPPPPAIEKPQAAAPTPPATPAAPAAPAIERPQAAEETPEPGPQASAAPPPAAVPAPPPPPAADTGAIASAPAAPPATQQAALPRSVVPTQPGEGLKVIFELEEAKLSEQARNELKSVVDGIIDQPGLRIQLLAYAGGESLSSSRARRVSLSRALAVRSYLIENGLRSTRIDVRALGDKTTEQPVNRVDVNIIER